MDNNIGNILLSLAAVILAIITVAFLVTRTRLFNSALEGRLDWKNQAFLVIIFGLVSILGTYASVDTLDVRINFRDLGPMIAGLVGGPVAGVGAGLIGGLHRYLFLGGGTTDACSLATVLAGLFGGVIWYLAGKRFINIPTAVAFAALQEVFHMILVLLIAQPFSYAVSVVENASLPMILSNSVGMLIFAYIIKRSKKERTAEIGHEGLPA
jgi:phosphoserine phosphatase RsbU/P